MNLAKSKIGLQEQLEQNPKVVRSVRNGKMILYATTSTQNKLIYKILPDGIIFAYAAKGFATCPPGYLQPALRMLTDNLLYES